MISIFIAVSHSRSKLRKRNWQRVQIEALEHRQLLATITVNTAVDNSAPDTTLSLRQAIEVSNGTLLDPPGTVAGERRGQ
jgi:myo-inositol catabolism protein IolC